jgi:peptidoglycan-associated lipoprotein
VTCGLARVHFEFDSAELTPDTKATLDQMAGCLQQNDRLRVRLEGNTDERGTRDYNEKLGERRAQAVLGYLEQKGVSTEQLNTISFGKDKPLCLGKNEGCWSLNRRTAIRPICKL